MSGAPNTSTRQGTPIVVLVAQRMNVTHRHTNTLDNRRLNMYSTLSDTVVCVCVRVCTRVGGVGRGYV